jgi:hypothetical protein
MRIITAKPESARARRRRLDRKQGKKLALMGGAAATAMAVGMTPMLANADTYLVGFPEWLSANNVENDADTIYNSILEDRENPVSTIVGWGTGGVDLNPVWVQWYNPNLGGLDLSNIDLGNLSTGELAALLAQMDFSELTDQTKDQYYTPREWGQTGTEEVMVDNPAYRDAFEAALAQVMQEDRDKILAAEKIDVTIRYTVPQPSWWTKKYLFGSVSLATVFGPWTSQKIAGQPLSAPITQTVRIDNPFENNPAALDQFLETGEYNGIYPVTVGLADLGISKPSWLPLSDYNSFKVDVGGVDYTFNRADLGLPGESWDQRAEALVDPSIPKQIPEQQPVFGWIPGEWTTTTLGQWVSPTNDITGLQNLNLAALLSGNVDLSNLIALTGMSTRDLAYYLSGDMGFLAPLLNWTTYIHNTNLIGYGDGAITAGLAYQKFIDAVKAGEITAGTPLTDGRYIVINTDENGNRVINLVNHSPGNGQLDEIISSYPLPDDLVFPNMPRDAAGNPVYPAYSEVPGGVIDIHLLTLSLLQNPGRANGGLYSRFAPIYQELTGVNPVTPDRQDVLPEGIDPQLVTKVLNGDFSGLNAEDLAGLVTQLDKLDGKPIVVTLKADATWEYDLLSDAPVTANGVAWANSLASSLLLVNLASTLLSTDLQGGELPAGLKTYTAPDGTLYATLTTDELPLVSAMRLPATLLGLALEQEINDPLVDALTPALELLTNIAYTDVVRNADGTYSRTLDKFHEAALFGTQPLTRAQQALVPGDLIAALGAGFGDELTDVLIRLKDQIVEAFGIELTADQNTQLEQALAATGAAVKQASRQFGDGLSEFLTGVESELPAEPEVTQQQLAAGQREVGKQIAQARDWVNDTVNQPAVADSSTIAGASEVAEEPGDGEAAIDTTANADSGEQRKMLIPSMTRNTSTSGTVEQDGNGSSVDSGTGSDESPSTVEPADDNNAVNDNAETDGGNADSGESGAE